MSKKFQNTPREFDFTAVAQQLADSAGVDPALLTQVYGDPLLQHAEQYQTENIQYSPSQRTDYIHAAQNASGVSPRVEAIVEKYGLDNIRNHFDGGDVLLHEDDEQQRLAKKKAEAIRRFKAWIPNIENAAKVGYDAERDRWYPYESVECGSPTIQYGLKLDMANPEMDELLKTQLDEQGMGYLTSEQANYFLDEDIDRRYGQAEAIYDAKRGKGAWDKLSPYSQSLLLDFQFNPGLSKFPKMMNGYDTGNKAQIQAEIGRTYKDALGVRHPLKDRNEKMKLKTDSLETFYPIFDPFVVK